MPEPLSNYESRQWDATFGDVKFLVLQYKLRDSWNDKVSAENAMVQLLQYYGRATDDYWRFIRALRLTYLLGEVLKTELPDDVRKVVRRTDKTVFRKGYQAYLDRFWNLQFLSKRQAAKKPGTTPYKRWNWGATRNALRDLATDRPNTFRHVLAYYEAQAKELFPMKPPALVHLLRYMRDIEFELEVA